MTDPEIMRQRAKVLLVPDEELQFRLPRREATVDVMLRDGSLLSQHVDAVRGTAENPMPQEEVVAKARDLMGPVLGAAGCAGLIERILALQDVGDVRTLRALLQA